MGQLEEEYKKKRKKEEADIADKKKKIVQNCKLLLQDIEDRMNEGEGNNYDPKKVVTFTDMKAKRKCIF